MSNETCTVELSSESTNFRSRIVELYLTENEEKTVVSHEIKHSAHASTLEATILQQSEENQTVIQSKRDRERSCKYSATTNTADITIFL